MAFWGGGGYGTGPWGGGEINIELVRDFAARNSGPNEISLNWKRPANLDSSMEIIVVRRKDAFPMELFNDDPIFSSKIDVSGFTDPVQVEIFRGTTIRGTGTGAENLFTDGTASFSTSPSLAGRILRDSTSHNFRIISNTATTITVDGTPTSGQYVILADFPNSNEEVITGTVPASNVGAGFLRDTTKNFVPGSLKDRIVVDSGGTGFVITNNTDTLLAVSGTPLSGGYTILQEFADFISPSDTIKGQFAFVDNYLNKDEAENRSGSGLEDEQFYYYTAMTHRKGGTSAEVLFTTIDDANTTQAAALSTKDREFGQILEDYWPNLFAQVDSTGDFADLMQVFGFGFNELYSFVNTFDLTNPNRMYYTILPDMARQTGISEVRNQVGRDAQRRIISDLLPTWKLKGTKQGIVDFIRIITTWDVTNGTQDASEILDDIANVSSLRFFDATLGSANTRLFGFLPAFINDGAVAYTFTPTGPSLGIIHFTSDVDLSTIDVDNSEFGYFFVDGSGAIFDVTDVNDATDDIEIAATSVDTSGNGDVYEKTPLADVGRFFTTLPGVIIPGFFDFREFVVEVKDVALFVGESDDIELIGNNNTKLTDNTANYGSVNSLIGNFLVPKQGQLSDIFKIVSNTTTTITVEGVARNTEPVGEYAVLSPLNVTRFLRITALMREFAPSFARMGIQFT